MSHKGHEGAQGWQGSQNPNDLPDPGAHGGYPEEERIDPAFDLSKSQLSKMVEEALAGTDFSAVLDAYFKEIEDQVTAEVYKANEEQAGGFNLGSLSACRFLAVKVVNNVLRVPHKEEETHGKEI